MKERAMEKDKDKGKHHERYVFLFNDLLLVTAIQKGINVGFGSTKANTDFSQAIFTYKYSFDFQKVEIADLPAASEEEHVKKKGKSYGFTITKCLFLFLLSYFFPSFQSCYIL